MKSSTKGLFVILVIVMSLFAVESVCAETVEVEGYITFISPEKPSNMIVLDDEGLGLTEVYGMRFGHLEAKYDIVLAVGSYVTIVAYEVECFNGSIKLMASTITVGTQEVLLRPLPE